MVSQESVEMQLKRVKFNLHGWGRTEARELKNILLPGEEIYEVVNGIYEGGFAMLIASDVRMLLVDKKPLNYLTVEDMRFDMINELDYSHRLIGARISVSAGNKNLKFMSYNQARLRKLMGHVQHCMADAKKQQSGHQVDQKQHLEQINQQLQAYLLAQHQQQQKLHDQLMQNNKDNQSIKVDVEQIDTPIPDMPEAIRPSNELSDYLFAQSLLAQYKQANGELPLPPAAQTTATAPQTPFQAQAPAAESMTHTATENHLNPQMSELYAEGMQEIFGRREQTHAATVPAAPTAQTPNMSSASAASPLATIHNPLEINALKIAYSKLPLALRNRRFGSPSFHSHSMNNKHKEPSVTTHPLREM